MPNRSLSDITSKGLRARMAIPSHASPAGILVLPAWAGITDNVDQTIEQLAGAGFTALAWDPFSAYEPGLPDTEKRRITRGVIQDKDARLEHSHWVSYLLEELGVKSVGVIGFCMGGRMALHVAATDHRLKACAAHYPTIRTPIPAQAIDIVSLARNIECPVQVHYPGRDEGTTYETFSALRAALDSRAGQAPTLASYYPHAEHGFLTRADGNKAANLSAKAIAWPATLEFFRWALLDVK